MMVIVSSRINFTVFSFVIVFNNKEKYLVPYLGVMMLLVSNNINIHSLWMQFLQKYFGPYVLLLATGK